MRRDIKREIVETARELFNRQGYNSVSTRDIAQAMGISKGNLTYHFRKKEDIIEAVVREMHSRYRRAPASRTLEELGGLFRRIQSVIHGNAYYFWHYTQLSQLSPEIREMQATVLGNQYRLFDETFANLIREGLLGEEEYPGQHRASIQALLTLCIYWMPQAKLQEGGRPLEDFLHCAWSIVFPLLTPRGKAEYLGTIHRGESPPDRSAHHATGKEASL